VDPLLPILALLLYSLRHLLPNIRRCPYGKPEQCIGVVKLRQCVLTLLGLSIRFTKLATDGYGVDPKIRLCACSLRS